MHWEEYIEHAQIGKTCMWKEGADPGFCVRGDESRREGGGVEFYRVFSIIEAFLAAILKHFKDVINLI